MARHSLRARVRALADRVDAAVPVQQLDLAQYLLDLIAERKMPPHPSTARRLVLDIQAGGGRPGITAAEYASLDHPAFMDVLPPLPDDLRDYLRAVQAMADTAPSPWE